MLVARSAPECRLYLDLHGCSCGESRFEPEHVMRESPEGALLAVYEGTCPGCGLSRRFTFMLDEELPPPPPAFGGRRPSSIICPGEFLLVAAKAAGSAPTDLAELSDRQQRATAHGALATAVAAVEEVLKFVPEAEDAVPQAAVTSAAGKALYSREPGRFSRARLEAVLTTYRESLTAYRSA